jgi:N-acetylglutamate synthase-like GNAT family acetyltransferase
MINVRRYRPGDEEQIVPLLKVVFQEPIYDDMKYWKWMFKDNPTNMQNIWVAEEDGKIVGHWSFQPNMMKIDGKRQIGMQAMNLAVHPDYQGRGIFSALAKQAYSDIDQEQIPFLYTYANKQSFPILTKRMGWFEIPTLPVLIKPLDFKNILIRKIHSRYLARMLNYVGLQILKIFFRGKKFSTPAEINITRVTSFDDRFDAFWEDAGLERNMTVRNKKYLTWRYIDKPDAKYVIYVAEKDGAILGYTVLGWKKYRQFKIGVIVDVLTLHHTKESVLALISKANEHFQEERADAVICNMQDRLYYGFVRKMGFFPLPFQTNKLCLRVHPGKVKASFSNFDKYFLTYGDRPHAFSIIYIINIFALLIQLGD